MRAINAHKQIVPKLTVAPTIT